MKNALRGAAGSDYSDEWEWIRAFSEVAAFADRSALLCSWAQSVYHSRKVILFYHSSRRKRYALTKSLGISKAALSQIVFTTEPFIRLRGASAHTEPRSGPVPLKEWEWFSRVLIRKLSRAGLNMILPLWSGSECLGGIVFRSSAPERSREAASFEAAVRELAFFMEIAFVDRLRERLDWEKKVLLEVGRATSSLSNLQTILNKIIDSLREIIPYNAAGIFLISPRKKTLEYKAIRGYPRGVKALDDLKVGEGVVGWSIKHGEEVLVRDVKEDSRYLMARKSTRSEMIVPIVFGKKVMGAFILESDHAHFFRYYHLEILRAFAAQTASVLQNSMMFYKSLREKEFEKELEIARGIQKTLLPQTVPQCHGYEFAAMNRSSMAIGGDFYDFAVPSEGRIGVAIGDVAGKGIPGAILMATLCATFRGQALLNSDPDQVMNNLNNIIYSQTEADKFATFFYGTLDCETDTFHFTNAGHNPPVLAAADGTDVKLTRGGHLLGFLPGTHYASDRVVLHRGDVLLLYTDGVSEAMNGSGEEFGEDRLIASVRRYAALPAEDMIDAILSDIQSFSRRRRQEDDLTMVIVKKNG